MLNKIISKTLIAFLLLIPISAFTNGHTQYSIFLIPDKNAETYIKNFNNYAAKQGVYEKYNITPFIQQYPVSLNLYTTSFKRFYLESIVQLVKRIANTTEEFDISADQITISEDGFITLNIGNDHDLQGLSNIVIRNLAKDRYKDSNMPSWIKFHPAKQKLFNEYGTSNAFDQFEPNINISTINISDQSIKQMIEDDFDKTIQSFNQKSLSFKIIGIGFGYADDNGQVAEVIKKYNFKDTKNYSFEKS
ncbi:2'-5' RNA ligase family protein [Francisella sp. Scap27]|uniref:2'-5' RNA ligase family protein n=1 Tax=Francisella sp. Scap27 TaxID=2589986 RepID=UPI0015BF00D4|nr:2'-5' RNA ligase family protein [Francisella sp. Scap27]QLE78248.1 2'-5' RNA ligase family protein [Francisella sp. Scap27]